MPGFETPARAVVIGASGGIGGALVQALARRDDISEVVAMSRSGRNPVGQKIAPGPDIDVADEESVRAAMGELSSGEPPRLVFIAVGLLSDGDALQPEKSYRHQTMSAFQRVFAVNTFGPALVARHAIDLMPREGRTLLAALSARVGSISDNQIGGWHAYRASKAALNMLIRNYAIEVGRRNPDFIAVGLQPGTVDTALSKPFQGSARKILSPEDSATRLVEVLAGLGPEASGKLYDHAGASIDP